MKKSNKEIVLEVLKRAFIVCHPTMVEQYFAAATRSTPRSSRMARRPCEDTPTLTALSYEPGMAVADGDLVMVHGRYTGWGPSRWWRWTYSASTMARWSNTGT